VRIVLPLLTLLAVAGLIVRQLIVDPDAEVELTLLGLLAALIAIEILDGYRTERQLSEEIVEGETRYRFAVELTPAVVYLSDPGEVCEWHYVSPYVQTLLGYSPDEWLADPTNWMRHLHPDDLPQAMANERLAFTERRPVPTDYRIRTKSGEEIWVRDVAAAVMRHGRRVVQGVIYDITEMKLAEGAAQDREQTLHKIVTERTEELERSRIEMMQRLAIAAELHDDGSREHTLRVGYTAAMIAQAIDLDPVKVELIALAAPLHDIGKLGISNEVLLKQGPLTPDEEATMRQHTVVGAHILAGSEIPALRVAERVALTHHEHWDGSGYPRGLDGAEIPIEGRITMVADVFDALAHARPYKQAWPTAEAVGEIERGSGNRFDPAVVAGFLTLDPDDLTGMQGPWGSVQSVMTR
jgi:PAS domain S-box-containing protein/putative nucleotidyltransferase with HDIG domain